MMLLKVFLFLAATLPLIAPSAVCAQSKSIFPTKTITLVVPFTPSSGSDVIARIIGPKLSARWGQSVIVDNKPGASGNLGANVVAKAAPDGHTLLMAVDSFTMAPAVYKTMPYDPVADFAPVARLAEASYAFAVNASSVPAKDMRSLIAYIKANPGKVNYATPGNGTPHHLTMEMLKSKFGLDILHVPYKGISGALTDLMGGQVQLMFGSLNSLRPYAQSGKLRLLAITGVVRNPLAPEVPTFREQGIDSMDGGDAYYFVLAPGRTPPELVARLNSDFNAVISAPDVKAELQKLGLKVSTESTAQLANTVKSDLARWHKVVIDAGIKAD